MKKNLVALTIAALLGAPAAYGTPSQDETCSTRFKTRRGIADGRFMKRPWSLDFYRDKHDRPCLTMHWHKYGSLYPFEIREGHPRLGILDIASTDAPGDRPGAYLMTGYIAEHVAKVTFRLDGTTDEVRIVDPPAWTELPKNLFVHFIDGARFNRDRTGTLRLFDRGGRLIRKKVLHRRDFFFEAEAL